MKDRDAKLLEEAYNSMRPIKFPFRPSPELSQIVKQIAGRGGAIETGTDDWLDVVEAAFGVKVDPMNADKYDLDIEALQHFIRKLNIEII